MRNTSSAYEYGARKQSNQGSSGALDEALGLVFLGTLGRSFYAVNVSTGHTVWTYSTSAATAGCSGEVWSTLGSLGVGDSVYFGAGGTSTPRPTLDIMSQFCWYPLW